MNEELAMRSLAYLMRDYKEQDEVILNDDDIEAIKYLQKQNEQLKQKYLNAVANYESEKSKNQRAINKIDNMFNKGDEYTIIDDLIELDKILKGENN